ncbi:MAG: hypothetical protein CVU71_03645 [Deltaproteobacteria bacterium HGW-Deltaproteobacteria-6]|jgi:hypothetical protein|nr:MAG: hypothetical protein CVU71_03645 [Deltaproteobacteria bacterium HGW-Deltaproteobacteria-6]
MGISVGKDSKGVYYNGTKVAQMGTMNLSGFTRDTLEDTEFDDDIKTYVFGTGDGGGISFNGNYDNADTTGQGAVDALCVNGTLVNEGTAGLVFYINQTNYWGLSGGNILMTKGRAFSMDKSGIGQISFEGKISGGKMVLT